MRKFEKVYDLIIQMVKDLEKTRDDYRGYAYVRTMRNILVGKDDAVVAPLFKEKPYYGIVDHMKLDELESIMDKLVNDNRLDIIYTDHGKLYCTHEYYKKNVLKLFFEK